MRFTETLNAIRNKIIRKKDKMQPEDNQKLIKNLITWQASDNKKMSDEMQEINEMLRGIQEREESINRLIEKERTIRRYRAFAYHHKKRRIRKKYLKKLIEISPVDRFAYMARKTVISIEPTKMSRNTRDVVYSKNKFPPGCVGSIKMDHVDSRIEGGVR